MPLFTQSSNILSNNEMNSSLVVGVFKTASKSGCVICFHLKRSSYSSVPVFLSLHLSDSIIYTIEMNVHI